MSTATQTTRCYDHDDYVRLIEEVEASPLIIDGKHFLPLEPADAEYAQDLVEQHDAHVFGRCDCPTA